MLFADDIVLIAESMSEVNAKFKQWCTSLEGYGLRLSHSKTEYLCANFSEKIHEEDVAVCVRGERGPVRLGFGIKPEPQPYIPGF